MLAIIIPYFKLTFFDATLQSLANQTDKRFKVYVGDDASPEDCSALLQKFEGQFDFIYHRFETNLGGTSLTQQWERCIALSDDEEWLMILGDDDLLGVNVVEEFYKLLTNQKNKIDLIKFNLSIIDSNSEVSVAFSSEKQLETSNDLLETILLNRITVTASEFIFSRKVYSKNNGFVEFPLAWFSDYATWLLFSKENGFYNINNATVFWRLSQVNISAQLKDKKIIQQKIKSLFLFLLFLEKNFTCKQEMLKFFANSKIKDFSFQLPFVEVVKILCKELFTYNINFTSILVLEMISKKICKKIKKI